MKGKYIIMLLLFLFSCKNDDDIKRGLEIYSDKFIKKKKIDVSGYKKEYSIVKGKDYTHYYLTYYKIIEKDSSIIYFIRDEWGEYFIGANSYFDINVLGIPKEELE